VDLEEFHRIACAAVGRDPPQKRTSDVMKRIWDLPTSPGVRCPKQQHQMTQDWDSRLAAVDGPRGTLQQKRPSRAATWASISPSPSPFRVLGQLSNVGLVPFTPKLLSFEKPEKLFYKDRKASLEHGIENDPEAARRSISPKTPVPSLVRLPASPSPTPPPPSASPPLKRRASSIDVRKRRSLDGSTPRLPRKRHSDESASGMPGHSSTAPRPSKPPKRQRTMLHVSSVTPARPSLNRCNTEVPTLESLLTSPRFGNPALKACPGLRSTQSMSAMPASKNVSIEWSLDGGLFYIQPSTSPEPYSLVAGRYASQRLGTLDALLWGIGWQQGGAVESKAQAKRGLIFVDVNEPKFLEELVGSLEARWTGMKSESRRTAGPLFVLSFEDLGNLYRIHSSGDKNITPIWSSCILKYGI
ncbi:hypothetical protein FRC00_010993, partial [Tulasnella sp. 408]